MIVTPGPVFNLFCVCSFLYVLFFLPYNVDLYLQPQLDHCSKCAKSFAVSIVEFVDWKMLHFIIHVISDRYSCHTYLQALISSNPWNYNIKKWYYYYSYVLSNIFFLTSLAGCSSKSFKLYSPKEPPNGSTFPPFHPGTMLDRDVGWVLCLCLCVLVCVCSGWKDRAF